MYTESLMVAVNHPPEPILYNTIQPDTVQHIQLVLW